MPKVGVSLCILAHNRIAETANLIGSLRGWSGIDLEVCIADQESGRQARTFAIQTADQFCDVSDRDLWNRGFGWAKQKAVSMASNDWVIVGDPGEVWHETVPDGSAERLADTVQRLNSVPAFRTYYGGPRQVQRLLNGHGSMQSMHGDICRIFDKRKMRVSGYIHEAPVHIETGALWAVFARKHAPVGLIEHVDQVLEVKPGSDHLGDQRSGLARDDAEAYIERKRILYDHLLHTIVKDPKKRHGTDFRWWTAHWNTVVAPRFREISFEEWKAVGG